MFELTVTSHFDAAHYLVDYPGKCSQLHGHRWGIEASVTGEELNEIDVLYDFIDLKRDLEEILDRFDHKYMNEIPPFDRKSPTAENLAKYLYDELAAKTPAGVLVSQVTVRESENAALTYRP